MADLIRAVWPFIWAELIVLFLMVAFPALVTVPAKWLGGLNGATNTATAAAPHRAVAADAETDLERSTR
jgi:hypothetical protein